MKVLKLSLAAVLALAPFHQLLAEKKPAPKDEDRMVCRTLTTTGSRFEKRICRKASDWHASTERSAQTLREVQSRPMIPCTSPSGASC